MNIIPSSPDFSPLQNPGVSSNTMDNLKRSVSYNTRINYKSDLNQFRRWLTDNGLSFSLPVLPECLAEYMTWLNDNDYAISTIKRRVRAISWMHKNHGLISPSSSHLITMNMKGIINGRVEAGRSCKPRSKQPVMVPDLKAMIGCIDTNTLAGIRDKAMLLLCFAGALRRSELVGLRVDDIVINAKGADINICGAKGDKSGEGEVVPVVRGNDPETCPVLALLAWYKVACIGGGAAFRRVYRSGRVGDHAITCNSLYTVIKKYTALCGLNPDSFGGHSLRSGMLTSAAEAGADLIPLAQHARHKNTNQTMHYIKQANRYINNPSDGLL